MKMEVSIAEVMELINEIRQGPQSLLEMIRANVKESVGQYLSELMETEMTGFLGRDRYERAEGESNHRNGSYSRKFAMKGIGEVGVKVPPGIEGGNSAPKFCPAASNTRIAFEKIFAPCFWAV